MSSFPFFKQPDSKDCGPTCLKIITKHYGKNISFRELRALSETHRKVDFAHNMFLIGTDLVKIISEYRCAIKN